jgi:hypothetical protein
MELDDIREVLYAYTKAVLSAIEDGEIEDFYEQDLVEDFVNEFLIANEEITGVLPEIPEPEED